MGCQAIVGCAEGREEGKQNRLIPAHEARFTTCHPSRRMLEFNLWLLITLTVCNDVIKVCFEAFGY